MPDFRRVSPEESSPFNHLLSNALKNYKQQVSARYAPQMQEAEIFNKKIGPLATLATSPMFLQNPQFQESLGRLISQNMGGLGGQQGQGGENNFPTYTEQNKKTFSDTSKIAHELTKQGSAKTAVSGASGWLENTFGDVGKSVSDFLSGGKVNPDLYNKSQKFETQLKTLKQNAIQTGKVNATDAEREFKKKKNETYDATMERLNKSFPYLFGNEYASSSDNDYSTSDREMNVNINEEAHRLGVPAKDLMEDAEYFKTSPENIIAALDAGAKTDEEVMDYLKGIKNGQ